MELKERKREGNQHKVNKIKNMRMVSKRDWVVVVVLVRVETMGSLEMDDASRLTCHQMEDQFGLKCNLGIEEKERLEAGNKSLGAGRGGTLNQSLDLDQLK